MVFGIEYALRLWTAVEHAPLQHLGPVKARMRFALTPGMVIDLIAILPILLAFIVPEDVRVILLLRLLRFFKLGRYSPGLRSLLEAVYEERHALAACPVILGGLMITSAAMMHMIEGPVQPERFGSIPESMWWAVITLTTVGYGDAVPITPAGKVVAGITALFGLVMLALPVGIIATSFAEVVRRRDFVVTWSMVARVPLFSDLDAIAVADVMRVMRSELAEPGQIIVRRGDEAKSMFFIASGQVELQLPGRSFVLDDGQFFGENALISHVSRAATVRALTRVRLLVLDASDFRVLIDREPRIRARIDALAETRFGPGHTLPTVDLVGEELREARRSDSPP
jgi:voltage-gated potassium channel